VENPVSRRKDAWPKLIYIENQYLTSGDVTGMLAERLRQEDGPEVVVVLPQESSGWLEQSTMDAMRNQIITRLSEVDRHNRLLIVYPAVGSRCFRRQPINNPRKNEFTHQKHSLTSRIGTGPDAIGDQPHATDQWG
jgi:hypothetical protein